MNRQARERIVDAEVRKLERRQEIERSARRFADEPPSRTDATAARDRLAEPCPKRR